MRRKGNGSKIAKWVDMEYRRENAYKKKARQKCTIDNEKKCNVCKYSEICENREASYEEMD